MQAPPPPARPLSRRAPPSGLSGGPVGGVRRASLAGWLALGLVAGAALCLTGGALDGRALLDVPAAATRISGAGFPKTLRDPSGRALTLPAAPKRIASAVLASDEILLALLAPERVVSVTSYADDPSLSVAAGRYGTVVRRNHGGVEELLAVRPDLAIVAAYSDAATVRLLLRTGVPVLRLPTPDSFAAIREAIALLGSATGTATAAAELIADLDRRLAAVDARVAKRLAAGRRPLVLYYALGGFTAGPGSLIDEMIDRAGGDNLARVAGLAAHGRISAELAIALAPDVLLVSGWQQGRAPEAALLAANPAWRLVPAVASGRVYTVRGAWLTSASHAAVSGVEVIADLLHP